MTNYNRLLVVADPTTEDQKALKRALHLARKTQSSITYFLSIYDFSYEMTTMLSADERESMKQSVIEDRAEWLNDHIADLNSDSVQVDVKVIWHNRPFEAIIREAIDFKYDLVVKGTHEHDTLKSVIFTPTDWHLLRKCPTPVLLVKEHEWPEGGQVLAALNVGTEETAHQSLNNIITEEGLQFAEMLDASLHLVNSYPGTPVNIAIEIPEFDPQSYNESVKNYHQKSMSEHISHYDIDETNTHVEEGLPEDVIPTVAKDIDAELVILGTVGRTGISAALIGNTAEHVIDSLNCDVLALKPEGYVSPLAR
jgi:universal stress protein E